MKKLLVVAMMFTLVFAVSALAQDFGYGAFGGLGMITYDGVDENMAATSEMALGINLGGTVVFPFMNDMFIRGNVAYSSFFPGSDSFDLGGGATMDVDYSLGDFSFEGEVLYPVNDQIYAIGGLGMHMASIKADVTFAGTGFFDGTTTSDNGETKFGLHFGAGYKLNDMMSVEAKYIMISDVPQLRASFVYMLKEAD